MVEVDKEIPSPYFHQATQKTPRNSETKIFLK